jgi:hypothetical protein
MVGALRLFPSATFSSLGWTNFHQPVMFSSRTAAVTLLLAMKLLEKQLLTLRTGEMRVYA